MEAIQLLDGFSESEMAWMLREGYSVALPCPVHLNHNWCDRGYPFDCNIRVRPDEKPYTSLKPHHAFIYKITHVRTGMLYVGFTDQLSRRWAGHRAAGKREERKNDPLYRALNEDGFNMFVMEELEVCGAAIKRRRELDYMRQLDSWNPEKGYNSPNEEADYAMKVCFCLNPVQELRRHVVLNGSPRSYGNAWRIEHASDQQWMEELREVTETSVREGRRLMETIPSFLSPEILASPPPLVFRDW